MFYEYDPSNDVLRVQTHPGTVHHSGADGNLILDFDERGWLIGFSVESPSWKLLRSVRRAQKARTGRTQLTS